MYLDYFSLERHPFRITPDPSLFFPGGQDGRGVILNALIYGITSGEGILKVVGEVGSGKTMLCRMLEEKLPDTVEIVYLANPRLSAREILYAIAIELKLDVTAKTERLKVMHMLQDYLLDKHGKGGSVVVFVEEAQSMPLETLEEIRLLSNLETHQHKLMQIVLFGQPELEKILAQKNIRQLRERITHGFRLEPLTTQATGDYLRYRLQAAGCPRQNIFSPRAEKMIARAATGLTRRINILADKALLAAYADSPSRQPLHDGDVPLVLPRHVKAAIRDSDYKGRVGKGWLLGGLSTALLLVAGGVLLSLDLLPGSGNGMPTQITVDTGTVSRIVEQEFPVDAGNGGQLAQVNAAEGNAITADVASQVSPEPAANIGDTREEATAVVLTETASETNSGLSPETTENEIEAEAQSNAVSNEQVAATEQFPSMEVDAQPEVTPTPAPASVMEQESVAAISTVVDQVQEGSQPVVLASASVIPADGQASSRAGVDDQGAQSLAPPASEPGEPELPESPVTIVPSGLAELRIGPTASWLQALEDKSGYTIQMFSVPSTNPSGLEEYLQFLQLTSMLNDTYICFMPISSPNSGRWQVMHKEFEGVTPARRFVNQLPAYVQQYGPYVRNLNGVECSYPVDTRN